MTEDGFSIERRHAGVGFYEADVQRGRYSAEVVCNDLGGRLSPDYRDSVAQWPRGFRGT